LIAALLSAAGALALPGTAAASSGTITDVGPLAGGRFTATYTTISDRCDLADGSCGWFPSASQVGADEACDPRANTKLVYVGRLQRAMGSVGPVSETFEPQSTGAFKLCLFIYYGPTDEETVAEYVYAPPPPPAPPPEPELPMAAPLPVAPAAIPPAPVAAAQPPQAPKPPRLTVGDALARLPGLLRREYGRRYTRRVGRLRSHCFHGNPVRVRCRLHWRDKRFRYDGSMTLQRPAAPGEALIHSLEIRRTRRA
jgi:hypothetical protein